MRGVVCVPHGFRHHRPGTAQRVARDHAGSMNDVTDGCSACSGANERFVKDPPATERANGRPPARSSFRSNIEVNNATES